MFPPHRAFAKESSVCERVFSRGKLILTDLRGRMDPSTFEDVLILFYNNDLWDVYLANQIEEEGAKQRAEERQALTVLAVDGQDEEDEY